MIVTKYEADRIIAEWDGYLRDTHWQTEKRASLQLLVSLAKLAKPRARTDIVRTNADLVFDIDV